SGCRVGLSYRGSAFQAAAISGFTSRITQQLIGRVTERAAGGGSRLAGRRIGRIAEAMKFGGWQRLHAESGSALKPPIGKENTMKTAPRPMPNPSRIWPRRFTASSAKNRFPQ